MQIWKSCDYKLRHNNVITKNNWKQRENADLGGTKQSIYRWKGFDERLFKNVFFIEFEQLCQKLWAFMSILWNRSPNMVMARDSGFKFRK